MTTLGIDVSKWDGNWDAKKAKAAGAEFVFIKASQATFTDIKFNANWQKAKDAGLLRSAYHFLDYTKPALDQANYFANLLNADRGELPPVVDYEQESPDISAGVVLTYLRDFIKQLKSQMKLPVNSPIIYTGPGFWKEYGDTVSDWAQLPLWLAQYSTAARPTVVPAPWQRWTFWQYSDKGDGKAFGAETLEMDLNRFDGTLDDLLTFAGIKKPVADLDTRIAELEQRMMAIEQRLAGQSPVIQPPTPNPTPVPKAPDVYAVCTANSLYVRGGPGMSYPVIGLLTSGQRVKVLERKDRWARIDDPAGWSGETYLKFE
jgi:lysozyme